MGAHRKYPSPQTAQERNRRSGLEVLPSSEEGLISGLEACGGGGVREE